MRIQTNVLAVLLSFLHSAVASAVPHDIHCNFELRNGNYFCSLNDTIITTETVPLQFFNNHLPDQNDSTVTGIDSWFITPRNVNIQVVHPQLLQQFPNVQMVLMIDSQIQTLTTDSFAQCDELAGLSLARNLLTAIPPRAFERCTKLHTLDLTSNPLIQIDDESFFGLQNLQLFQLDSAMISNNSLQYLTQLRDLHLTNALGIESNALRHMRQLETLDISDNSLSLTVIQDAIDGIDSLLAIILNRNGYTSFDFEFFEQFPLLDEFQLIGNQLTTIPANSFKNFGSLGVLRLHSNQISTLTADSFAGLHNLEILTLNDNRLAYLLPNTFSELINLRTLDLSSNIITTIIDAETFRGLQNLQTLFLNNMQLTNLTSGMFEPLPSLQRLLISNGRITAIPPNTFTAMENLRELDLGTNQITRLNTNSFGLLPSLENLFISPPSFEWGVNEIERSFFDNLPKLVRFGGIGNMCINGVVYMPTVDFGGLTVFERCFSNWDASLTTSTTTTTEMNTTPSGSGIASAAKLWLLLTLLIAMHNQA